MSATGDQQDVGAISATLPQTNWQRLGLVTLGELKAGNRAKPQTYLIDDFIAEESVNIFVGDSGEGKSPFAYQMAICVALGLPFLGRTVKQGRVIYVDLENGNAEIEALIGRLSKHLCTNEPDDALHLLSDLEHLNNLEGMIAELRPSLVLIDSLRAYRPEAESKAASAASLMNEMKRTAKKHRVTFVFIHHTRKPHEDFTPALETTPAMEWLNQSCGARALINQSDTRLAFAKPAKKFVVHKDHRSPPDIALVIRGFTRIRGEFGPIYLERCHDEDGEAIGYKMMRGAALLFNEEMEAAWHKLPADREFMRKDAKMIYGKGDSATEAWLKKCKEIGILEQQTKGGLYRKVVGEATR